MTETANARPNDGGASDGVNGVVMHVDEVGRVRVPLAGYGSDGEVRATGLGVYLGFVRERNGAPPTRTGRVVSREEACAFAQALLAAADKAGDL